MNFSSKLIEQAVNEFNKLPGVGKRTALRFVLHLLKQKNDETEQFGKTLLHLKSNICYCKNCHNIADSILCEVCANPHRDQSVVCVIEDIRDFMAIENTQQYRGVYHILGGIISPMEGIGPNDLNITSLIQKAEQGNVSEIIMALSTTMEGDTTNFYLYKKLKPFNIKISTIARGISIGNEIEFADEITLGRSIINRIPYESSLNVK